MTTHDTFTPPPFSFVLMGHVVTGLLKAIVIAVALGVVGAMGGAPIFTVQVAFTTALVAMLVIEIVMAMIERPFVIKHRHPDPASVALTVISLVVPAPLGFLVAWLLLKDVPSAGVAAGVVAAVYAGFTLVVDRPWVQGDSQEGIRAKAEATKKMTREHFRS